MLLIQLANISNLNASLQVGDMIYATPIAGNLFNSGNQSGVNINANNRLGFLRRIDRIQAAIGIYILHVDTISPTTTVSIGEFIMFSKHNQSNDDVKGYYMEVKLVNDSRQKAELFSLGSEVTQSSK